MILYQIVSTYHLLCAIVHKTKYHKDKQCVLIVPTWITEKFPHYQSLEKYFSKIMVMDMSKKFSSVYPKKIVAMCDDLLKSNNVNIKDFKEIHAMACHYHFAAYLAIKNIPFYFWEDASGVLSRPYILEAIEGAKDFFDKEILAKL
jgi:hypothetical protein